MAEALNHPGPADGPRVMLAESRVIRRRIRLAADKPMDAAIQDALDGEDSAWISVADMRGDLCFVLPDRASDGVHAAWYSAPRALPDTAVHRAGIVWGLRDGRGFGHCHGLWGDAMGHLLLDQSRLARPAMAEAMIFPDARFEAAEDPETAFTLFKPRLRTADPGHDAALLRLAPHIGLAEGVADALDRLGWRSARIVGLGSLNTARFVDGRLLDSHATEFLIRPATVALPDPGIAVDIVGIGGACMGGVLASLGNPVCVTAELILTRF